MSEQSDKLRELLQEKGVLKPSSEDGMPPVVGGEERGDLPALELPRKTGGWALDDFAREAGKVTRSNGIFRRDEMAVTISPDNGAIELMDADRFRTYLADQALLFSWKSGVDTGPKRVKMTMTKDTALGTLRSDMFLRQQRRLTRVNTVRQPVRRKDGRIELLPIGYDEETGVFTMPNDIVIDETLTAEEGAAKLVDLHREFAFADWNEDRTQSRSLAVQVAAMVALFGALLVPHTISRQSFLYNANTQRSGKTLLAKIAIIPVMGRCKVRSRPDNPEEFRKVLDSTAMSANAYLLLDDLEGALRNNDLNAFCTAAWWSGRVMGSQREFEVPNYTMVFLTGHNLALTGDLAGRCLECKLHIEEADVMQHKVPRPIDDEWLSDVHQRGEILSALWALIRHWDAQGRPEGPSVKPGFEVWSKVFGGIVSSCGFGDPCERAGEDESSDPEFDDMRTLVTKLAEGMEKQIEYRFEELILHCKELQCFPWIIDGRWRGDGDERHFELTKSAESVMGKLFSSKYGGRLFRLDGRKVRFSKRGKNRHRKYLLTVEE